jgi:hypothetical protein
MKNFVLMKTNTPNKQKKFLITKIPSNDQTSLLLKRLLQVEKLRFYEEDSSSPMNFVFKKKNPSYE